VNKKINLVIERLNKQLGLFLSVAFGVFLFVLFFQPFPLEKFDFNNRLIFVSGLGFIISLFMFLVRVAYPCFVGRDTIKDHEPAIPSFLGGFAILTLSSVAFAFYLRFVGSIDITFYLMFKTIIICLVPPVVARVYDTILDLKHRNELLLDKKRLSDKPVSIKGSDVSDKMIDLAAENSGESLALCVMDIVLVKSADNYVEVIYKEDDVMKKKLLRNTMKNIEQLTGQYSFFVRCHRTCIVNTIFVDKLDKNDSNYWLIIEGFDEQIPVSRQYLLRLKEML